jgi:hypothetical protein
MLLMVDVLHRLFPHEALSLLNSRLILGDAFGIFGTRKMEMGAE